MGLFSSKTVSTQNADTMPGFGYLAKKQYYADSACQTLRPEPVIAAEKAYYETHNSCGGRVRYPWGKITDNIISACRAALLAHVDLSEKSYTVSFGLNTTQCLQHILFQLPIQKKGIQRIVTSDVEHNSVFLSTMALARTHALPRVVLSRSVRIEDYGALIYEKSQMERAVVVVNTMSNIDGQQLRNLKKLASDVREMNGILILDVCQTLAHDERFLHGIAADVLVGSGHKMYAPSLGFTIIKKQLLRECDLMFVGGGMVSAVEKEAYTLLSSDDDLSALLEPGLQNYAGIAGLYATLLWLRDWRYTKNGKTYTRHEYEAFLAQHLADGLAAIPAYARTNAQPSPIVSLSHKTTDAHQLATYLAAQGIMVRSGHFCCHYYCGSVRKFPPLLRVSIGLHTQVEDLDHIFHTLSRLA